MNVSRDHSIRQDGTLAELALGLLNGGGRTNADAVG